MNTNSKSFRLLTLKAAIEQRFPVEVKGGFRVDVGYTALPETHKAPSQHKNREEIRDAANALIKALERREHGNGVNSKVSGASPQLAQLCNMIAILGGDSPTESERKPVAAADGRPQASVSEGTTEVPQTREAELRSAAEILEGARLLNGSDWVNVGSDGVVDFDGKVMLVVPVDETIPRRAAQAEPLLATVRLRGRADLAECRAKGVASALFKGVSSQERGREAFKLWQTGFPEGAYLPLTFAVSIDLPGQSFDAGKNGVSQSLVLQRCQVLGRSLLVGLGHVTFTKQPFGCPKEMTLDIWDVNASTATELGVVLQEPVHATT